jgi:hypothetical protein
LDPIGVGVGCASHRVENNDRYSNEQNLELSIAELVSPMGMTNRRARGIIQFCRDYLALLGGKRVHHHDQSSLTEAAEFWFTRKEICSLFYCGEYAADAYQLFIKQDFSSPVLSKDHALVAYSYWKRSQRLRAS